MSTNRCKCKDSTVGAEAINDTPSIIDNKVSLLIAAGAAMAANCEICLNKIVPALIEARVSDADMRKAVIIGQMVKDKPAHLMKETADLLTGSSLSAKSTSKGSAFEEIKQDMTCCG